MFKLLSFHKEISLICNSKKLLFGVTALILVTTNFLKCRYTENLSNYSKEEQSLLGNETTSESHYGECNHCGEHAMLDYLLTTG